MLCSVISALPLGSDPASLDERSISQQLPGCCRTVPFQWHVLLMVLHFHGVPSPAGSLGTGTTSPCISGCKEPDRDPLPWLDPSCSPMHPSHAFRAFLVPCFEWCQQRHITTNSWISVEPSGAAWEKRPASFGHSLGALFLAQIGAGGPSSIRRRMEAAPASALPAAWLQITQDTDFILDSLSFAFYGGEFCFYGRNTADGPRGQKNKDISWHGGSFLGPMVGWGPCSQLGAALVVTPAKAAPLWRAHGGGDTVVSATSMESSVLHCSSIPWGL